MVDSAPIDAARDVPQKTRTNSPWVGYASALATVIIWAGFLLISRYGGKTGLTGWDIAALRLGCGSLFLLPFSFTLPRSVWTDAKLWVLAMSGGVGCMVLIYAGLKLAPASHGGILTPGLQPFLVTILAIFFLNTWPDRARVLALIPIALGVVAVAAPSVMNIGLDTNLLMGDLLLITASTVWAFYSVLAKRWPYDPWILTRFLCLASALVYLPPYLLFAPKGIMDASWTMLIVQGLYQGLAPTILAMMFFLKAVKELGAERTGALISLVPILAGLGAVPLLDEPLTPWLIAGLILVSGGAFLAARPKSHAKPKDAP